MPDHLTNPRAERVRRVRALSGRSARQRHGQFLVEGPQGVREAVLEVPDAIRDLYVGPEAEQRHGDLVGRAREAGVRVHRGTAEVLDVMSPDAQQLLAVVHDRVVALDGLLSGPEHPGAPSLVAVLAEVRDPGNAGAVIRTADAAGAGAVVLTSGSVDLLNPKVVRATAGSLFHVPVVRDVPVTDAVARLREAGLVVLAADGSGEHDLDDLLDAAPSHGHGGTQVRAPDLTRPTAWLFGNEAWGLPDDVRALADAVVRVPIHGRAESLNLATAAAVCLYASARAQRRAGPPADR